MISIKSNEDIEKLREGGKRLASIINTLGTMVKAGISTQKFEDEARRLIKEMGDKPAFLNYRPDSAKKPFPAALCVSVNDEVVHGVPNENPYILQDGDIVTLDLGLTHKGLVTDHAVTFPVGNITNETKRLMQVTKEALQSGIKEARIGNRIGDISAAIQKQAENANFGIVKGLSGHGVGYYVHEDPYISNEGRKGTGEEIKEGMVFAIEPMFTLGNGDIELKDDGFTFITKDKTLSAQYEHTIVVTEKGPEILTKI